VADGAPVSATYQTCGDRLTVGPGLVNIRGVPLLADVAHTSTESEAGLDGHPAIPAAERHSADPVALL
jgi:hypothetical protein